MAKRNRRWAVCCLALVGVTLAIGSTSRAQSSSSKPIKINVDATHASSQKILRSDLEIPVSAGPLTLYYSKWMPADHSPDGPITNLTGLKFTANGQRLAWHRDPDDMFAIHLDIPTNVSTISAHVDFPLSAPGPTIDFSAASS